jgi:hypothetical protein
MSGLASAAAGAAAFGAAAGGGAAHAERIATDPSSAAKERDDEPDAELDALAVISSLLLLKIKTSE